MKKLVSNKFLKGLAKMPAPLCLLVGILYTVIFLEKLYNIQRYRSNTVLIPSIVGAVLFCGLAIVIPVIRKRQFERMKKEEDSNEKNN